MGVGDEILAAGQAQKLYDADPSSRIAIVGRDAIPRWHDIWDHNPILARPSDVARGEHVRTVMNGPECRPYIVYPFSKESGWTFNPDFHCREHIARIYLTEAERARGEQARKTYGPYILIEPFTKHPNFRWALQRWEQLVAACPDLTFVQHVHRESPYVRGAHSEPATFREACGLIAHAEVYVRSESGLCHAAAALGAWQVTMFGGCMDVDVMGRYPRQACIVDNGPQTPCGSWLPCAHCADVMERISVGVVHATLHASLHAKASEQVVH